MKCLRIVQKDRETQGENDNEGWRKNYVNITSIKGKQLEN